MAFDPFKYFIGDGSIRAPLVNPDISMTAEQAALYAYLKPFQLTKKGIWLEAHELGKDTSGTSGRYNKYAGPADDPALFNWVDILGGTQFTAFKRNSFQNSPYIYTDTAGVTGAHPRMIFGGGKNTNALNGALNRLSLMDDGVEINDIPLIEATKNLSIAVKLRVPAPGSTTNGVTWDGTTRVPGGAIIGGDGSVADSMFLSVHQTTGFITFRTRNTSGSNAAGSADIRDGAAHTLMMTANLTAGAVNQAANTIRLYRDTALTDTITGANIDFAATSGCDRPLIGAYASALGAINPSNRFGGLIQAIIVCQSDIMASAGCKAAVDAYFATL